MLINRWLPLIVGLLVGLDAIGCGSQAAPPSNTPPSSTAQPAPPADAVGQTASPSPAMLAGPAAPVSESASPVAPAVPGNASSAKSQRAEQSIARTDAPKERPGLATQFGEDLRREARHTEFVRESTTSPWATTTIWYNDAAGAEAMARQAADRAGSRAEVELMNGGLVVAVTDEWFQVLPGFVADARPYAIGEANARYAIRVLNRSDFAFEVVASVDGLDVINGQPASLERRGYVVAPRDNLTIEGFRTSEAMIAAFRFGKVSESYSAQMGHGDRNVGVIGVAFFQARGTTPSYPSEDARLRQNANPFPGQYAPKPPGR